MGQMVGTFYFGLYVVGVKNRIFCNLSKTFRAMHEDISISPHEHTKMSLE